MNYCCHPHAQPTALQLTAMGCVHFIMHSNPPQSAALYYSLDRYCHNVGVAATHQPGGEGRLVGVDLHHSRFA